MKDPAFLFYPGDYLRDTQCLSAKSQVAYDRIMCEHMRNICISHKQLKFFTKRLSPDELDELLMVLNETPEGFQIPWVVQSIEKRRKYSESRRNNRKGKTKETKKDVINTSKTYDNHMENENEIVNEIISEQNEKGVVKGENIRGLKHGVLDPEFKNAFVQAYGKQFVHYRADVEQYLTNLVKSLIDLDAFLENVKAYHHWCKITKTRQKYARNWLNELMYENDYIDLITYEHDNLPDDDFQTKLLKQARHNLDEHKKSKHE